MSVASPSPGLRALPTLYYGAGLVAPVLAFWQAVRILRGVVTLLLPGLGGLGDHVLLPTGPLRVMVAATLVAEGAACAVVRRRGPAPHQTR